MSDWITARGIATAGTLKHGVADGSPSVEKNDPDATVYLFAAGATEIAVEGTPDELRQMAGEIVQQVDAHEQQQKREAA